LLKFLWLKGEGTKKIPRPLHIVFLTVTYRFSDKAAERRSHNENGIEFAVGFDSITICDVGMKILRRCTPQVKLSPT